nr:hypothetical protein [Clostridia bacterium]
MSNARLYNWLLHLANELLPMLFWIFLIFGFDQPYIAVLTMICALIHELGHYSAILLLKCNTGAPVGHISGFRIKERSIISYRNEIIILLSGPLANILLATVILIFSGGSEYMKVFSLLNLVTGLSNLLPIKTYDGYSVLTRLALLRDDHRLLRLFDLISASLSITILFLSLYMMYRLNSGYWLFGIFIAIILGEMRKSPFLTNRENFGENERF